MVRRPTPFDPATSSSATLVKRILVDSLNYLRVSHWVNLYAFVVMPNHVHCYHPFPRRAHLTGRNARFLRNTPPCRSSASTRPKITKLSSAFLERAAHHISGQQYKVWEDGYDARNIYTPDFPAPEDGLLHHNPCQPQWQLAAQRKNYVWSSARSTCWVKPACYPGG